VHADGGSRALEEDGSRVPSQNRVRSHVRIGFWRWSAGGVVLIGMLLGSILRDSLFVILALATYGQPGWRG
jgi:hypothetical protein